MLLVLALVLAPGSGFSPQLQAVPPARARHACAQRRGGWPARGARGACAVAQRASGSDIQAGDARRCVRLCPCAVCAPRRPLAGR